MLQFPRGLSFNFCFDDCRKNSVEPDGLFEHNMKEPDGLFEHNWMEPDGLFEHNWKEPDGLFEHNWKELDGLFEQIKKIKRVKRLENQSFAIATAKKEIPMVKQPHVLIVVMPSGNLVTQSELEVYLKERLIEQVTNAPVIAAKTHADDELIYEMDISMSVVLCNSHTASSDYLSCPEKPLLYRHHGLESNFSMATETHADDELINEKNISNSDVLCNSHTASSDYFSCPEKPLLYHHHCLEGNFSGILQDHHKLLNQKTLSENIYLKLKMNNYTMKWCQNTDSEDNLNPGDMSEPNEGSIKNYCKGSILYVLGKIGLPDQDVGAELAIQKQSYWEMSKLKLEHLKENFSLLRTRIDSIEAFAETNVHESRDEMSTMKVSSLRHENLTSHTHSDETYGKTISRKQNDSSLSQKFLKVLMCGTKQRNSLFSNFLLLVFVLGNLTLASGYQVELVPHRAVYFAKSNALYTCNVDNALGVQWYFNETLQPSNNTVFSSLIGVGVLRINNISMKFNSTNIECEGVYSNNGVARSVAGFMLVQGILDLVSNLNYSLIKTGVGIFWSSPFTLDVSDSNNDIMYCVDIFNSSSSHMLHSDCDISATHYSWEYIPELIACGWYEIQVKAFNPVGNSTASNTTAWAGEYKDVRVNKINFTDKTSEYEIVLDRDVCPEITELLISNQIIEYTLRSSNAISFVLENYRHYGDLTLKIMSPYGEIKLPVLNNLKTYDVNSSSIFTNINNTIGLRSSFFLNSSADGVLYALLFVTGGTYDISKSLFYPVKKDIALMGVVFPVHSGLYEVLAYDIDNNGIIQSSGLPSTSEITDIEGSLEIEEEYENQQCSLEVFGYQIEVKCDCNDTYFQLVLLQHNISITSKRTPCSQTIQVIVDQNESTLYNAIAFIEDANDGIFISRDSIFIDAFSVQQTSTTTRKEHPYRNTNILAPVIAESTLIFLLAVLLVVMISYIVFKCKRANSKRIPRVPHLLEANKPMKNYDNAIVYSSTDELIMSPSQIQPQEVTWQPSVDAQDNELPNKKSDVAVSSSPQLISKPKNALYRGGDTTTQF